MVEVGAIDDLRRHEVPRWRVDGPTAEAWSATVPGARVLVADGASTVVEIDPDGTTTEQDVLAAALKAGPVHGFGLERPSLTELYRDVVTQRAATEGAA